ncbi:MAG: hypothetical protein AAF065_07720 [Verrucomicrobiota bacterium]
MVKPTKDSQAKVSLEELLRFKRAERPDEAFWDRFDDELHHRMMQTLVKKDPWPIQLMRGLSGKLVQTTAIGTAAAILTIMVIQPAFLATTDVVPSAEVAQSTDATPERFSDSTLSEIETELLAQTDYAIEIYGADQVDVNAGVTREFGLDRIEATTYDTTAYSADTALSGFASTGLASLVY